MAIEVDTAAPPVPTVTANSPSSTGTPVISGVAEASSTVTVYSGDTALGQATADGGGAYSFTPATTLEDGTYSISATATDGAGNTGAASTALSLMVDTVVPGAPVLSVTTPTNDSTPEMGGTAEAGATVTIYTGGTQLGQTTATGGGVISFEPTTVMSDGSYTLTATATDGAGNTSPASGAVSLVVDTVSPGVPTVVVSSPTSDNTPTFSGVAEAGSTVELSAGGQSLGQVVVEGSGNYSYTPGTALGDGSYLVTATATDAAGNSSGASLGETLLVDTVAPVVPTLGGTSPVNTGSPQLTGEAEAGSTVVIYKGDTSMGQSTAGAGGEYSVTITALSDGSHALTAKATDAAGNTSLASEAFTVIIDTVAPAVPTISGTSPTNDATPVLTGTAEAASTVTVYDGGTALGQATVDTGGLYSFVSGTLSEGGHVITATATDAAGNTSGASGSLSLVVDQTAPEITLTGGEVTVAHAGTYTDPGATAQDGVDGTMSVEVSHAVDTATVGVYTVNYSVTDSAGNTGTESRTVRVTDQTAPVITLVGAATVTVEASTSYLDAGASAEDAVDGNLTGTLGTENPINETTIKQPGSYTVTYTSTDSAGNSASATRTVNVVDTMAPVITLNGAAAVNQEAGETYTDLGASAEDAVDGSVSVTVDASAVITR